MAKSRKSLWTQAYDEALIQVMKDLGIETCHQLPTPDHSWSNIRQSLMTDILAAQEQPTTTVVPQFTAKQIRDRWINHLAPGIIKGNWSTAEKNIIIGMSSSDQTFTFKDIAEKLPGRPCADVKNMYHSLVRSGKIKRNNNNDKPARAAAPDRPRRRQEKKQQKQRQQSESSAVDGNHNKRKSSSSSSKSPEPAPPKKKKYRKSGIPLEGAPPFASPNTTNAARVLMSLDMCSSNNNWPETAANDVTTTATDESFADKHLLLQNDKDEGTCTGTTSTVSALPTTIIDHAFLPESESSTCFCKVHLVAVHSNKEKQQQQQREEQLVGFVTLPSTGLTFAQARAVLQTELPLAAPQQQQQRSRQLQECNNSDNKKKSSNATATPMPIIMDDWSFTVPGQGRLTAEQEGKLRVDFLVTPETLGTARSPLHVTILPQQVVGDSTCSNGGDDDDDDDDVPMGTAETTMTV